ncbi:MAG: PhzF family phenazine biosynthesis protein [Acidobacteria bacterium]|nr:PhzF family phenazine biosynthesis protein [Acidobacteriota bacterium]
MATFPYLHLDVFTTTPLAGNQLAVFHAPAPWPADTMQAIAREMAFSETTFVEAPETADALARVRIFTPGGELPMAGHPTIGTAFALAHVGRIAPATPRIVFDLGVGPTPVALEWRNETLVHAWMTQPLPTFGARFDQRPEVALALGVLPDDLHEGLPVQVVSCGVPFAFVPMASRAAVDRATLDRARWQRACSAHGLAEHKVFVFTIDRRGDPTEVYSRMFAPLVGIAEDPGTGGASGPLGAYLVAHGVSAGTAHRFVSHQGVKMLRPCRIDIRIEAAADRITHVQIGGVARVAGTASLILDDPS